MFENTKHNYFLKLCSGLKLFWKTVGKLMTHDIWIYGKICKMKFFMLNSLFSSVSYLFHLNRENIKHIQLLFMENCFALMMQLILRCTFQTRMEELPCFGIWRADTDHSTTQSLNRIVISIMNRHRVKKIRISNFCMGQLVHDIGVQERHVRYLILPLS